MNQSNKDTDDILDAIKSMMSNDERNSEQGLPKDIIELTKPIDEMQINENESEAKDNLMKIDQNISGISIMLGSCWYYFGITLASF